MGEGWEGVALGTENDRLTFGSEVGRLAERRAEDLSNGT